MVKVSGFNILWAHEAEDWIEIHRKLTGWDEDEFIGVPDEEEKLTLETELYILSDIVKTFARKMIELEKDKDYQSRMKIWFNVLVDFYIEFWYEPAEEATYFVIHDYKDRETARIIFKDLSSIDYS